MPKGEHFKKDNPRNYQVSFKVNKSELDKLKSLLSKSNTSLPEFFRSVINEELSAAANGREKAAVSKAPIAPKKPVKELKPSEKQLGLF